MEAKWPDGYFGKKRTSLRKLADKDITPLSLFIQLKHQIEFRGDRICHGTLTANDILRNYIIIQCLLCHAQKVSN